MSNINNFEELTSFLYLEYEKLSDSFGIQIAPEDLIAFTTKSLMKYFKLYDKPLFRSAKRALQLHEAIETMPHGFIWKFFHYDLWQRVKRDLGLDKKIKKEKVKKEKPKTSEDTKPKTLYPAVVEKSIVPVSDLDDDN